MAAIPYASASSRPVPAFSIPFRSIISSSSFSSSSSSGSGGNQRTPSPSATPSTPPLSTSHRHSTYLAPPYFSSAQSSNSTSAPAPLSAYDQGRRHSVVLPQQPQQQQQQEQEQLQPHPMLYSAGRRSRRAARGPEVSSGGRRTGGRDIDDMTDAELRALDHAEQQGRHFRAPPPPPAPAPPVSSSTQGMMTSSLAGVGGNIAQGRTSDSSDLPAYFVDPSLPQYEYRARPVWSTYSPPEASSPPSSSAFYPTDPTSTSAARGAAAPSYSYFPSPLAMSSAVGTAAVGPASVRGTPFPSSPPQIQVTSSVAVAGGPSTPERRILGLPNRNSPPVPPRSLPNTTGLSVLRGSSLLAHSAAAAAAAAAGWSSSSSSSLGMSGIRNDREDGPGLSMMVDEGVSVGRTAVPPPAYEEQDSSARQGSAPLLLSRSQTGMGLESTSIDSVATVTVGMSTSASVPSMSISASGNGSGSGSGSAAAAMGTGTGNAQPPLLVPFVPTRSVSLPGSSLASVQSAMAATSTVRNRTVLRSSMLTSSPVTMAADEEDVDVDDGVPGSEPREEEEEMMEEILQTTTSLSSPARAVLGVSIATASPPSSTNTSPRTPTSSNIHQAPLPSPPNSATSSAFYPSSSSFSPSTTRRPISQLITPFSSTVGASTPSPLSGLAWDFGLGYPSASPGSSPSARLSVSNAAFAFGRAQEDVARFGGGGGGGGSVAHPPIPSERRSSRAVGRHMRAATIVLSPSPSSSTATPNNSNSGQSSTRPNPTPMTLPRRSASRTRSRTPLSMYEGPSSSAADSTNAAQTQAQAAAVALFGLSAREWAMRLAWLGEQEGEGAGAGTSASRRSASVSAL